MKITVKTNIDSNKIKNEILAQARRDFQIKEESSMQLTKDADQLVCSMYKAYLEKRKSGINKLSAKHFEIEEIQSFKLCSSWSLPDIKETVAEINRAGFGTMYFSGGFFANDQFIIYMENRFVNGIKEVTDFLSKFIP